LKQISIQDIIHGCQQGKATSQRALVEKYSGILYTVCLRYMKEEMAAQDILQDSFVKIFRAINTFDPKKGSLEGWMRKITVNTALKQLDKRKLKFSSLSIEALNFTSREHSIVDQLEANDLVSVIRSLPDGYRQVFNLSVIEGYSHREIGKILGIEEVSSRSNLSRAKQILRTKLNSIQSDTSWAKIS